MPLTINKVTGVVREYPDNILRHRVLGRNLEIYVEPVDDEVEEDKVVIDKKVFKKSAPQPDAKTEESDIDGEAN